MSEEEIIEMANKTLIVFGRDDLIITFARLLLAKQIEIDAGICDNLWDMTGDQCAAAIRGQMK